jgi:exosome complex component MTR3
LHKETGSDASTLRPFVYVFSESLLRLQDAEDRSVAISIHQALESSVRLELFPKSTIDIFITIIENDGIEGCVASGAVAASTALADAGIDMIGLVVSCTAVSVTIEYFSNVSQPSSKAIVGGEIWMDPTEQESHASTGGLVLACMPALSVVTSVWQSGQMKAEDAIAVS